MVTLLPLMGFGLIGGLLYTIAKVLVVILCISIVVRFAQRLINRKT